MVPRKKPSLVDPSVPVLIKACDRIITPSVKLSKWHFKWVSPPESERCFRWRSYSRKKRQQFKAHALWEIFPVFFKTFLVISYLSDTNATHVGSNLWSIYNFCFILFLRVHCFCCSGATRAGQGRTATTASAIRAACTARAQHPTNANANKVRK